MKKLFLIITALIFLTSCETTGKFKKPEFKKPFSKCPPKEERSLKDILCRE